MDFLEGIKQRLARVHFDFVRYAFPVGMASLIAVLVSWVLLFVPGPNWGIDFTGGTEVQLRFDDTIAIGDLRDALASLDIPNDAVQEVGGVSEPTFKVRIQDPEFGARELEAELTKALEAGFGKEWIDHIDFNPEVGVRFRVFYKGDKTAPSVAAKALEGLSGAKVEDGREERELIIKFPGLADQVRKELAGAMGSRTFDVLSVDAVGPKVGAALRTQGVMSIVATLGLILLYVAFRFDLAYAPGAVLALIHDVSVTAGLFVIFGKEFNLTLIGALLTILGYSLNDTIVIYDRIRENRIRYSRNDLRELVNQSINETLMRTFATAGTTLVSTIAFLILGTDVIRDFVLAITMGVVLGTYSTIYVATPMILVTEKYKPWLMSLMASPEDEAAEGEEGDEDVPEQFTSESEKRRRERLKNAADEVGAG